MAVFRGQINVIELIKPIALIIQSLLIGQGSCPPTPTFQMWSHFICHHVLLLQVAALPPCLSSSGASERTTTIKLVPAA